MPAYCRKRAELFTISVFLGGAVTAVAFGYYRDQIRSYFDMFALHSYLNLFLVCTYLLPALVFYSAIYWLNALLVRLFGSVALDEQRKAILKRLIESSFSNQALYAEPVDLVEEVAWESLGKFWRAE